MGQKNMSHGQAWKFQTPQPAFRLSSEQMQFIYNAIYQLVKIDFECALAFTIFRPV